MMKILVRLTLSILLSAFCSQSFADADVVLPAKQLRPGCFVELHKTYPSSVDPNVNANVFDLHLLWKCGDAEAIPIGEVDAEGTGPEIVTVFYRPNEIVMLARWASGSAGADFAGDLYQVNAFRLQQVNGQAKFERVPEITKAFGEGYDGVLNGKHVTFPYKNAAAIRARLAALGL
ncbi:MAG TPA: hypothetical protein VJU59_07555 [Paraburkholderia sp.]|uniref:hypothetical protein n=1 Tax=Paraburkholderia sp. TaxID=1926495 RepID=UPI002B465959|nr:hypothetical protein [Paraburkholderia sp.]HKR39524.1 hypothetical protein [Paraburkholderia sp.]